MIEGNVVQLFCGHVFHFKCVKSFFPSDEQARSSENLTTRELPEVKIELVDEEKGRNGCPNCHEPIETSEMKQWVDYDNRKGISPSGLTVVDNVKHIRKNKKRNERRRRKEAREQAQSNHGYRHSVSVYGS